VQSSGKLLTTGLLLSDTPSPEEGPSHESQHREDEEDEEEDLRPSPGDAFNCSEADEGSNQGDHEELGRLVNQAGADPLPVAG